MKDVHVLDGDAPLRWGQGRGFESCPPQFLLFLNCRQPRGTTRACHVIKTNLDA